MNRPEFDTRKVITSDYTSDRREEPQTKVSKKNCASLSSDENLNPVHWCYWMEHSLIDKDGAPTKAPQCPIYKYATKGCQVGINVSFQSYQLVEKELGGVDLLNDGVEIDAKAYRQKIGQSGGVMLHVLELLPTPPDLDAFFTDEQIREANILDRDEPGT